MLTTIPGKLASKSPSDLLDGAIVYPAVGETHNDVLARLRCALLNLREDVPAEWSRIMNTQQRKESFAEFAKCLWVVFREFSGVAEPNKDDRILLEYLKSNAGPHVQQVLCVGANPSGHTFNSMVNWATEIERRIRQDKKQIVFVQWVAEGKPEATTRYRLDKRFK